MAYTKDGPVDQDKITNGKPLTTATKLEMDKASEKPFWDKDDEMASGQSDHDPNFSKPHNPSKGQK